jgi:hypothetical protein
MQFEQDAELIRAAFRRYSVKVSLLVEYQRSQRWICPVLPVGEGMEHGLLPAFTAIRRKLKHGSISLAPDGGRPIEVARAVRRKGRGRIVATAAACKPVKYSLSLGLRLASGNQQPDGKHSQCKRAAYN